MNDLLSAEFDLGNGFTIGSNERNWKELSNEYMRVKILNNSSDPTKYFLVTSYKKAGDYWIGVYQNTGPQSFAELILTTGQTFADIQIPFIENHPLSTRVSLRSSNFKGKGLDPQSKFDESFIYTDQYKNGVDHRYNVCLRNVQTINQSSCASILNGYVKGLNVIPSSSSFILMVTDLKEYPQQWYTIVYSIFWHTLGFMILQNTILDTAPSIA